MTFSGGEPLMQAAFVAQVMERCRQLGFHTAVETSGCGTAAALDEIGDQCDLFLFDVKQVDDARHRALTGVGSDRILVNLRRVVTQGRDVVVRVPIIEGLNDDADSLQDLATLLREAGIKEVHLLPYHTLGLSKYRALDREPPMSATGGLDGGKLDVIASGLKGLVPDVAVRTIVGTGA